MTFEESLSELESVIQDLERGDISLDESLTRYERGVNLLKQCYARLESAEAKVRELTGVTSEGEPVMSPFLSTALASDRKRKTKPADGS
jgi:exodeoxyribonuclease VII small subunit